MHKCYSCNNKCKPHESIKEILPPYGYTRFYCLSCYKTRKKYSKKIFKLGRKLMKLSREFEKKVNKYKHEINKIDMKCSKKTKAKNAN